MKISEQKQKKLEIMRRPWLHTVFKYRAIDLNCADYYYKHKPIASKPDGRWVIDYTPESPGILCYGAGMLPDDYWPGWYKPWPQSLQTFEEYQKLVQCEQSKM